MQISDPFSKRSWSDYEFRLNWGLFRACAGHFVPGLNLSMVHRVLPRNLTDFQHYVDMAFRVLLVLLAIAMLLTSGTERSKEVSARGRRLCLCSDRVLRLSSQGSEVSRDISFHVPIVKQHVLRGKYLEQFARVIANRRAQTIGIYYNHFSVN